MSVLPIPLYFPIERRSRHRRSPTPLATLVMNPSTGKLELHALVNPSEPSSSSSDHNRRHSPRSSLSRRRRSSSDSPCRRKSCDRRPSSRKTYSLIDVARREDILKGRRSEALSNDSNQPFTTVPVRTSDIQKIQNASLCPTQCAAEHEIRPPLQNSRLPSSPATIRSQKSVRFVPHLNSRRPPSSTRAIRRSSVKHPWTTATLGYGACSVIILGVIVTCYYVFRTTTAGKSLVHAAMRYIAFDTTTEMLMTKTSGASFIVEVLPNVTSAGSTGRQESTLRSTFPKCTRSLCRYQTDMLNVKPSVEPCTNFYRHVCHRWIQEKSNDSSYFEADQTKHTEIVLDTLLTSTEKATLSDTGGVLYRMCKEYVSFANSKANIVSLLERVGLRKWPYQDTIRSKSEMWETHARIYRTLGTSILVTVSSAEDPRNSSKSVVTVDAPDLFALDGASLPSWYIPALYRAVSIFDAEAYEDISHRILKFVSKLAQLNAKHKERPLASTIASFPFYVPLIKYTFSDLLELSGTSRLLVRNQAYLRAVKSLIRSTKSADVFNYFGFRVILQVSPLLSDEFYLMSRAMMTRMSDRSQISWPRWQRCLWFINDMDPILLLTPFRNYVGWMMKPPNIAFHVGMMLSTFSKNIAKLEWCKKGRGSNCSHFANSTKIDVVDPHLMSLTPVVDNFTVGSFFDYYLIFKQKSCEVRLTLQDTIRRRLSSVLSVFGNTVTYDSEVSTLYIPIVLAYNTLYNLERDMFLRVPYLAQKIFAELLERLHAYLYPSDQLILNIGQYPSRCARYSKRVFGVHGQWLFQDLLMDITSWYLTYQYCMENNWPGVNIIRGIGKEKNIFLFAAVGRCRNKAGESVRSQINSKPYVQAEEFVNEPFLNMRPFSSVWACANDSAMNPPEKCTLWDT